MIETGSILLIGMVVGLFGSLIMLASDMLLHFSSEKLEVNNATESYSLVMRELPESHDDFFESHFSSTLCTLACLPYAVAFATLPLAATNIPGLVLLFISAILLAFSLIYSATHHPYLPRRSFASKVGIGVLLGNPKDTLSTFSRAVVIPAYAGVVLLTCAVLTGTTLFPQWMVLATPLTTLLIGLAWQHLPRKIGKPLNEYWNHLIFILMFSAMAAWIMYC